MTLRRLHVTRIKKALPIHAETELTTIVFL